MGRNGPRNNGCNDPVWTGGDRSYRLILEYSKGNTATTSMASYAESINKYYNPFGIFFEINIIESPCTTCLEPYDPNWWQDLNKNGSKDIGESYSMFSHPYSDCIYGRITENGAFDASGQGNYFSHGFWSIEGAQIIIHELGHALGLSHTFNQFKENDHEVVNETSSCSCNCLEKADLICDTPSDPYKSWFEYPDEHEVLAWNSAMFDETNEIIKNSNDKVDLCGTNWKEINDHFSVFNNHMSYHGPLNGTFTKGQEYMMKKLNENKPWQIITGTGSGIMSIPRGVIDEPTTYSESKIINSDMEIKSTLIIKNANLFFNGATKIVMKSGGKLILDNAKILTNTEGSCFAPNGKWKGI